MITILVFSMLLLSLEKITYMYVYNHPRKFQAFCKQYLYHKWSEVNCLGYLLIMFKIIQISVFMYWWNVTGSMNELFQGWAGLIKPNFLIGSLLILAGQYLNLSVFYRLGNLGVLYGKQFGYEIPWATQFPFSVIKHPQYIGTVISIWGCFIAINFSYEYWYAIPALETILYILGAEQEFQTCEK